MNNANEVREGHNQTAEQPSESIGHVSHRAFVSTADACGFQQAPAHPALHLSVDAPWQPRSRQASSRRQTRNGE
jgi:hypothetical protein